MICERCMDLGKKITIQPQVIQHCLDPFLFSNADACDAIVSMLHRSLKCNLKYPIDSLGDLREDVCEQFAVNPSLLKVLLIRVSSLSVLLKIVYVDFMNLLLDHHKKAQQIMKHLDAFGVRKILAKFTQITVVDPLVNVLKAFQQHVMRDYHRGVSIQVNQNIPAHQDALDEINLSKFNQGNHLQASHLQSVGVLGLATIHFYCKRNPKEVHLIKPMLEIIQVMISVWGINPLLEQSFHPIYLLFEESFAICVKTWIKLWKETKAKDDYAAVGQLLRHHLQFTIQSLKIDEQQVLQRFEKQMIKTPLYLIRERIVQSTELSFSNQMILKYCS
ncbi:hypothetical protein EDD86DRAFT_91369 [Gorgonomyces haynaldii]|nr:hypothetical protein EDD86DRAFT_91369 [Gorgonomyces haynaldii]